MSFRAKQRPRPADVLSCPSNLPSHNSHFYSRLPIPILSNACTPMLLLISLRCSEVAAVPSPPLALHLVLSDILLCCFLSFSCLLVLRFLGMLFSACDPTLGHYRRYTMWCSYHNLDCCLVRCQFFFPFLSRLLLHCERIGPA